MFKILGLILLMLLGVFVFIYGGYDDSPGAQLLGVIIAASGVFFLFRMRKAK